MNGRFCQDGLTIMSLSPPEKGGVCVFVLGGYVTCGKISFGEAARSPQNPFVCSLE